MDSAYQKFFKEHAGYPKFKSKHDSHKSYTTNFTNGNIGVDYEKGKVKLPKLKEAKQKVIQYSEEHHTDKSVIMTIAGVTNSKIDYNLFAKGDGRMCTLFDEIAKENEKKGRLEGKIEEIVETGFEFGLSEAAILERLQRKLDISLQKAEEYFERFQKQNL